MRLPLLAWAERKLTGRISRMRYFRSLLIREKEEWERLWPQMTEPGELVPRLFHLLRGHFRLWSTVIAFQFLVAGLAGAITLSLKSFWEPFERGDMVLALPVLAMFLGLRLVQLVIEITRNFVGVTLRTGMVCRLRHRILHYVLTFPLSFQYRIDVGCVVTHVNRDAALAVDIVTSVIFLIAEAVFTLIGVGAVVLWLNWQIGLTIVVLMISFLPLIQVSRTLVGNVTKRLFSLHAQILNILHQSLFAMKYIKAMGFEEKQGDHVAGILNENRTLEVKAATIGHSLGAVLEFAYTVMICLGLAVGAWIFPSSMGGSLIVPLTYALFSMFRPIRKLITALMGLEQNIQGASRVFGTFRYGEEVAREECGGVVLSGPVERVRFRRVRFGYSGNSEDEPVLERIDLELRPGRLYVVTGPSGIGKTTLCDLLLGLHRSYDGEILVNSRELRELDMKAFRGILAYVPQDPILIRGTIRQNLVFGYSEKVSDGALEEVLEQARALGFVRRLAGGLEAELGERGVNLSGGERQRLCLARALLRGPRILVLDEPTAALDEESEDMVLGAIRDLRYERIVVLVSHRPSTLLFADEVLAFDADGQLRRSVTAAHERARDESV